MSDDHLNDFNFYMQKPYYFFLYDPSKKYLFLTIFPNVNHKQMR